MCIMLMLIFIVEKLISLYKVGLPDYEKYYLRQIKVQLEFLYKKGIIEKSYPVEKLVKLDKEIMQFDKINSMLMTITFYKIPYVEEWRKHKYARTVFVVYFIKWLKSLMGKPI